MANTQYHINSEGKPGVCVASKRPCRYGDSSEHYSSPEAAAAAYERSMSESTFGSVSKKVTPEDNARELTGRYYDEVLTDGNDGSLSEADTAAARERYIDRTLKNSAMRASVLNHFVDGERAADAAQQIPGNTFVTVLDSKGNVLTEDDSSRLGLELTPGTYRGRAYDPETDSDYIVDITANDDGSSFSTRVAPNSEGFFEVPLSPAHDSAKAVGETAAALSANLRNQGEAQLAAKGDRYYSDDEYESLTLLESADRIDRALQRADWSTAEGSTHGIQELNTLSYRLNKEAHEADEVSAPKEAKALWYASEQLADITANLKAENSEAVEDSLDKG